ncbi:ATP-binding protein [Actinomadura meyerae]|uniref:ATP-binding protein n=1 Tax=Actinomadura meyerae TaxID=240840 RepID=UPI0015C5FC37|nr:ATP-binding protein [Actinomadura meyerae]
MKGVAAVGVEDVSHAALAGPPAHGHGSAGPGGTGAGAGAGARLIGAVTLPGVRRSVGAARNFVRDAADGLPAVDDLVLVVSELVANAITHTASGLAGGQVTVVLTAGGGLVRLEVADDGAGGDRPHVRDSAPRVRDEAETGRGMRIVAALSARWGFRADGPRTVVWAEFPAPGPAARGRTGSGA